MSGRWCRSGKQVHNRVIGMNKAGNISDRKIFLLCISSGVIGFSLIGILPYEIPLFLRVSIAFFLLGIPLLDLKKIALFGITGGLGFFITDYIFSRWSDFGWVPPSGMDFIIEWLLIGVTIGLLVSIALGDRKAIVLFPLTGAILSHLSFNPISLVAVVVGDLGVGLVFGMGMCLYLLSIKKTKSLLRSILLIFAILYVSLFGFFILMVASSSGDSPPIIETTASIGEVVEISGIRMTVTNYTFLQNNTVLKVGIMIQNTNDERSGIRDIYLLYKQDEHLVGNKKQHPVNMPTTIVEPKTTVYYDLLFDNLPGRLRTKDHAFVWEIWDSRGANYIIWQTK